MRFMMRQLLRDLETKTVISNEEADRLQRERRAAALVPAERVRQEIEAARDRIRMLVPSIRPKDGKDNKLMPA